MYISEFVNGNSIVRCEVVNLNMTTMMWRMLPVADNEALLLATHMIERAFETTG